MEQRAAKQRKCMHPDHFTMRGRLTVSIHATLESIKYERPRKVPRMTEANRGMQYKPVSKDIDKQGNHGGRSVCTRGGGSGYLACT